MIRRASGQRLESQRRRRGTSPCETRPDRSPIMKAKLPVKHAGRALGLLICLILVLTALLSFVANWKVLPIFAVIVIFWWCWDNRKRSMN